MENFMQILIQCADALSGPVNVFFAAVADGDRTKVGESRYDNGTVNRQYKKNGQYDFTKY
jgi:hypothetical protein